MEYQGISAIQSKGKSKKDKIFEHNHPELQSVAMATERKPKEKIKKTAELMRKNQSKTTYCVFR